MKLVEAKQLGRDCRDDFCLKNISFEITEKGIYGFLGKSGSGKSELAKLLAGITEADVGSLEYKEKKMFMSSKTDALIKKKIGYVPDKCIFDENMTVIEAMDFIGRARSVDPDKRFRQIKEALELTGLTNKSVKLVGDISLSEKKRLSIAASLIGNPDIVIMDDPLRYHDKTQASEVKRLIELLGKKKVVLFFCSRPEEVEALCTYTGIISNGELVLWDSVESILNTMRENGSGGLSEALEAFSEIEQEDR